MDATTFDRLTTDLAVVGTHRGLLLLLAAIPLVGVLADLLDEVSEASCSGAGVGEATGADTVATATIRGMTRGAAEDTTTSPQDSQQLQGRHARPVLHLRKSTGECITDANQTGQDCGQAGQICQRDGTCA